MSSEVVQERLLAKEQQEQKDTLRNQQKEEAKKKRALDRLEQAKKKEKAKIHKVIAQARARVRKDNEKKAFIAVGFIRHLFELAEPLPPIPRAPQTTAITPHRVHISNTSTRPKQPVPVQELPPTPVATHGGRIIRKPQRLLE